MSLYYQHGEITIYHGDSREILPSLEVADLLLTDPPYGIGEAAGKNKRRGTKEHPGQDFGALKWDDRRIDSGHLYLALGAANSIILWGGNYYSDNLKASAAWLVWDKQINGDFSDCELAWTNLPGSIRRKKWTWNGFQQENIKYKERRVHPTQKPLALMVWCVQQADEKAKRKHETIIDPFMGSGTTLEAAKLLNRQAVGIEREEAYCEAAARRLQQEVLPF